MEAVDVETIKKRSVVGVVALTSRTLFLQIIAFLATFILTLLLSPEVFGVFYIVSAFIAFLGYFSDIGLAAALVQKKNALTSNDLATTFTIQQLLVGVIVIATLAFSATIAGFYGLSSDGVWLLRALIFSFFLSSLKTIPSVLLERRLAFNRLVIPQIIETVGFYGVAVFLAYQGWGVASFTWAVLARGVLGVISMYIIEPWFPAFSFSRESARRLMRFGIPFQFNSFLALVKDDLLTLFLGKILPMAQVGYIGWAKKWAEVPLRLIMDNVIRVTFPAFSRLQEDKDNLGKAIEKTLLGLSVSIFPISVCLFFFIKPLVTLIPRYSKWEPALFSFSLFVIASAIASLSTPLTNALNAVGRIKTTLAFMILWTVLTWAIAVPLVLFIGYNGVAIALLVITLTIALVVLAVKKVTQFSFGGSVRAALVGSVIQGTTYAFLLPRVPWQVGWLLLIGMVGGILYTGAVWMVDKRKIEAFLRSLRKSKE